MTDEFDINPDAYRVKLEMFEGPMDLLLHLIKKNEIDIYDIPIQIITGQYLEYIELMKQLNLDIAGEFLVMAAELIRIKSKMLLPTHGEDDEEEDGVDPRDELVKRLLEYQQFKGAAEELRQRDLLGRDVFVKGATAKDWVEVQGSEFEPVSLFKLVEAFRDLLAKAPPSEVEFIVDRVSVRERIIQLLDKLKGVESIAFHELFDGVRTKKDFIVTFLAVLEMVRLSIMRMHQADEADTIRLFPVSQLDSEKSDTIKDDYL